MVYITGDTHGGFERLFAFCREHPTSSDDIMIILGDAGINYFGGERDERVKAELSRVPLTLLCIHGNHEMRPQSLESCREREWRGGVVYCEESYPNILYAKDGEIYNLEGKRCIALGGAYSVDKHLRLARGWLWFEDEQPSEEIKAAAEKRLAAAGSRVDIVLSHTCPAGYIPYEAFISGVEQAGVDYSTEEWLDAIESRIDYRRWYCGHYHIEKQTDKMRFMFESIEELKIQ